MASLIYNSLQEDMARGNVIFGTHSIYAMLVGNSYTPDKDLHTRRSDVTNEVTGAGYASGGIIVPVTIVKDNTLDQTQIILTPVVFPNVTVTAYKTVYYRNRGGAASADELVACVEYPSPITTIGQDLPVRQSIIRMINFNPN